MREIASRCNYRGQVPQLHEGDRNDDEGRAPFRSMPLASGQKGRLQMTSSNRNIQTLFQQGVDAGTLSADSLAKLKDLGQEIEDALGIDAADVPSVEVVIMTFCDDDTGSIQGSNNEQTVRDGHNFVLESIEGSTASDDVLVGTHYLVDGLLHPYTPLNSAPRLDARNYIADGSHTPLFDRSMVVLGAVIAKEQEFSGQGVPVRTISVIITDGWDNASRSSATDVAKIVKQMLQAENHIIAFMGIADGKSQDEANRLRDLALEMGVPDQWILTPKNKSEIRKAFGFVSRAAVTASQGGVGFQQLSQTGFGQGIS